MRIFKAQFARYGSPSVLISDNGPQFFRNDFIAFTKQWDIDHRTSIPSHSQSNGMVESAIKTAKRLIHKAIDGGWDPFLAILDYRNTPTLDTEANPV